MRQILWVPAAILVAIALFGAEALLSSPPTTDAAQPLIESHHEEFSFDIDCGTFVLHEEIVADITETIFFDSAGNEDHVLIHQRVAGVITNPEGETFRDPGHLTVSIDLAGTPDDESDDTVRVAGLTFAIRVPGEGVVVQWVGLEIYEPDGDVIIHGPHDFDWQEPLCAALG